MKRFAIVTLIFSLLGFAAYTLRSDFTSENINTPKNGENEYEPITVLELFTSQGCSSCPAADKLLEEVKKRDLEQVFTLSYHVDYWNYIGWKDPFSSSAYAEKQSEYNNKLGYRGNYTPEVVVNGKSHFTGSNRSKMDAALLFYGKERTANTVAISKKELNKGTVEFEYAVQGSLADKQIRALLVLDERTTEVKRGENRNRTIKNSNIVVAEKILPLGENTGAGEITVPKAVKPSDKLHLILLVENNGHDITAASKTSFSSAISD